MDEGEIVAAIVAGEPAGLAAAYDRYAPGLHAYCLLLLAEPSDAADAVQGTFIIAVAKAGGLRDRGRFRPWLYAVARNECFRRLRAQGLSAPLPLDAAREAAVGTPDPAGPERGELRALVVAALAGLNPGDREVIELSLRHVLDGQDLADALGVSRKQAYALLSRARGQFEGSLGALLVARGSHGACPELDDILADWDGNLTILLRNRINRHTESCHVCGERRRRELSPAMLLSLLPLVALPAGLRGQVFRVAADGSAGGSGYRDLVVRRAEPFDRDGFPRTIEPPGRVYGVRALGAVTTAAVVAAALLGSGTVVALDALRHTSTPPVSSAAPGPIAAPGPMASGSDPATQPGARQRSGSKGGGPVTVAEPSPTAAPEPTLAESVPTPAGPAPSSSSPSSNPPRHSHTPAPPPSSSPPPSPGTLETSSGAVVLQPSGGVYTGQFTITAEGGPVPGFTIDDPAQAGDLGISPSTQSLAAGQSVTITVTVDSSVGLSAETDLTVNPGGLMVAVDYQPG